MNLKTAWWTMMIIYAIDLLIVTPYALFFRGMTEVGTVCAWGFYKFGFIFFPTWLILFGIILWIVLEGIWWVCWKLPFKVREAPKWAMVITWALLMGGTIIHNLWVLL